MIRMTTLKKKAAFDYVQLLKWLCVALMVAFIVCQFLPYFQYESVTEESRREYVISGGKTELVAETRVVSMADYTWLTENHEDLFGEYDTGYYNWEGETFNQNDVTGMPFLATLLIVFGLVFFLAKGKSLWPCLFAIAAGGYATYAYLVDKAGVYKPFAGSAMRPDPNQVGIFAEMIEKTGFKSGISYNIHLVVAIALLVAGIAVAVPWIMRIVKWFTVKKRHY